MEDFMGRGRIASIDDPQYNIIGLLARNLHRFACGLGGHDLVLKVESRRMALQCVSCPYETPGWTLEDKRQTEPGIAQWHVPQPSLQHTPTSS
jgi:hypothetical protein